MCDFVPLPLCIQCGTYVCPAAHTTPPPTAKPPSCLPSVRDPVVLSISQRQVHVLEALSRRALEEVVAMALTERLAVTKILAIAKLSALRLASS
jgi:hypothetical protein